MNKVNFSLFDILIIFIVVSTSFFSVGVVVQDWIMKDKLNEEILKAKQEYANHNKRIEFTTISDSTYEICIYKDNKIQKFRITNKIEVLNGCKR